MPDIICDTDFLSSFLKIDKLKLVKQFFNVKYIYIPAAVFNELSQAVGLSLKLYELNWVKIKKIEVDRKENLDFSSLGEGEIECISLCKNRKNSILLTNDVKATRIAVSHNIKVLNISSFLLLCKRNKFLELSDITKIINDLKNKDFYEFGEEEVEVLLRE